MCVENIPCVSIVTPSYNSSKYIEETVQSVKEQTFTNWEMIIVDDCSKDDTREILNKLSKEDSRIKVILLQTNSGAAVARNTAIEAARGKYIAFLDSDDLWLPQKLEKQLKFMEKNDIIFSFTKYDVMDEDGNNLNKPVSVPESIDYHGLLKNTIIGCLTVMINIEKLGKMKMPEIRTRQDFAFWLSILRKGHKAFGINETLARYRYVSDSISSNKLKAAKRNWQVYRKIEKLGFFYSVWCFINYAYNGVKKRS
ncbi:teichuronic acid biosynthesis protein TuaG [Metabacillus halosaccharovorans]|uniref:Glycosyltransferase n=1 Tax=Metabacillus halosaccharovorans TaxID=930124 RepID=A0ABT3DCG5_9BACI|nr:glycosyltransferase family 2 protein [Metabacillus halosaccharovorans]MCV9884745.1 glycosyltransferase [Metabacillus halosaccharovorans]